MTAKSKMEALLKAPPGEPFFLVEGNIPLVMPFLVNYLVGLYYENEPEAATPSLEGRECRSPSCGLLAGRAEGGYRGLSPLKVTGI